MARVVGTCLFLLLAGLSPVVAGTPASADTAAPPSYAASAERAMRAGKFPSPITKLTAVPGPQPGQATFKWKSEGQRTDFFRLETALTPAPVGKQGRNFTTFKISKKASKVGGGSYKYTLTAAQANKAGAGLGTANYLHFRLAAVNETRTKKIERRFPSLEAVGIAGRAPTGSGANLRVGDWNVRLDETPGDTAQDQADHPWSKRSNLVADQIVDLQPGVVGLQAVLPRMVPDLKQALPGYYRLTREDAYDNSPGQARILYDDRRFETVHDCTTSNGPNCKLTLEGGNVIPVAKLRDKATLEELWVVTAHLTVGKDNEGLRERQIEEVVTWAKDQRAAEPGVPVIFTGDINTQQRSKEGHLPHRALIRGGFYDSAAAVNQVRLNYSSVNHFATPERPDPIGFGPRLDVIMMLGMTGASRFEIVLSDGGSSTRGTDYPSDHNFVYADLKLP